MLKTRHIIAGSAIAVAAMAAASMAVSSIAADNSAKRQAGMWNAKAISYS